MNARRAMAVIATTAVLSALAACASTKGSGPEAAGSSRSATACAPAAPDPTETAMDADGLQMEPLPADVRCLPGVSDGQVMSAPGTHDSSTATPDAFAKATAGRQMLVGMKEGVSAEDGFALCQRLTQMGYGSGGQKNFTTLAVAVHGSAVSYVSTPDRPACLKIH